MALQLDLKLHGKLISVPPTRPHFASILPPTVPFVAWCTAHQVLFWICKPFPVMLRDKTTSPSNFVVFCDICRAEGNDS